jgi:hypothetical protein
LRLLICTSCWKRPLACKCEGTKRTADKQHVTNTGWQTIDVYSTEQVLAVVEAAGGDPATARLLLSGDPDERRKAPAGDRPLSGKNAEVLA